MLTPKDAYNFFKKKYPELKVTGGIDLNKKYYVFVAPNAKNGGVDFNDPYYAVDKKSGEVSNYTPTYNLDEYLDAIHNRQLNIRF